jgi:signal transduction histidine kinase
MNGRSGRIKVSLYARFMIVTTSILIILVGLILWLIQRREVAAISEQAKSRGLLVAENIATINQERFEFWDAGGIKASIEDALDENLLYVVVFDKFRNPYVFTDLVKDNQDITCCSRLPAKIDARTYSIAPRNLVQEGRTRPVIEIEIPVFFVGSEDPWGSVKVGMSLEEMRAAIRETRLMLILIGCGGLLLGTLGAALLAKRITGPLRKLVEGTVRISKGDFSHKIEVSSADEIGDLARGFNEMTRDLLETRQRMEEANKRLVQAEKLASIGRLSATIAHEIRNPLTSVKLNIQKLLQDDGLGEEEKEHLGISAEGIVQIEKFIKELLDFARVSVLNLDRFSAVQIMEEALKMMRDAFREKHILLERSYADDLPLVQVDGDRMRQALLSVLRNALEAVDEGGRIAVALSLADGGEPQRIRIRISDNGCGIPEKDWEMIFEPFFTTKPTGFGLGLSNARKIVEQHRGSIRVQKRRGKGTAFEILIPCEVET